MNENTNKSLFHFKASDGEQQRWFLDGHERFWHFQVINLQYWFYEAGLSVSEKHVCLFSDVIFCWQLHCWTPEEACEKLASVRPQILVRSAQLEMLRRYHQQVCGQSSWESGPHYVPGLRALFNIPVLQPVLRIMMYTHWRRSQTTLLFLNQILMSFTGKQSFSSYIS